MHFKNYPHDTQTCNLEIESSEYTRSGEGKKKLSLCDFPADPRQPRGRRGGGKATKTEGAEGREGEAPSSLLSPS